MAGRLAVLLCSIIILFLCHAAVTLYNALHIGLDRRKIYEVDLATGERRLLPGVRHNWSTSCAFSSACYTSQSDGLRGNRRRHNRWCEHRDCCNLGQPSRDGASNPNCWPPSTSREDGPQVRGEACWHQVEEGETLEKIASKYSIHWRSLWLTNPELHHPLGPLAPHSWLRVGRVYQMTPGEGLAKVVQSLGLTWQRLLESNPHVIRTLQGSPIVVDIDADYAHAYLCVIKDFCGARP